MTSPTRFGRYEVREVLGRGAMGLVYLAADPLIPDRRLAVKVIEAPSGMGMEELESRFAREYRAAGALSHPNVVTILDVGKDGETTYVVMEYVGTSLEQKLDRERVLPVQQVEQIALQLGSALDYAHSRGVIHRDVKPANILLTSDGTVKIADFGIAKHHTALTVTGEGITSDGAAVGTPAYMSPEQAQGQLVSGASDQFSMGVVLYRMLTGERPFNGDGPQTVMYRIVHEDPIPPATLNRSVPVPVSDVILRALAKNPHDRYPSCMVLAQALRDALAGVGAEPTVPLPISMPADEVIIHDPAGATSPNPPPPGTDGGRRGIWMAAGAAALLVLAVAAGVWMRGAGVPAAGDEVDAGPSADAGQSPVADVPTGALPDEGPEPEEVEGSVASTAERSVESDAEAPAATPAPPASPAPFQITTEPPGARVRLDGELLDGVTPVSVALAPDGEHQVTVQLEGYDAAGWAFSLDDLTDDQQASGVLHFPLTASFEPGQIAVRAGYPVGVALTSNVEGFESRTLDPAISHDLTLRPGLYRVVLSAPDVFLQQAFTITVTEGEEQPLLAPEAVAIRVSAFPENCRVRIDGRNVGTIPVGVRVARGQHEFQFEWPLQERSLTLTREIVENDQRIHAEIPE